MPLAAVTSLNRSFWAQGSRLKFPDNCTVIACHEMTTRVLHRMIVLKCGAFQCGALQSGAFSQFEICRVRDKFEILLNFCWFETAECIAQEMHQRWVRSGIYGMVAYCFGLFFSQNRARKFLEAPPAISVKIWTRNWQSLCVFLKRHFDQGILIVSASAGGNDLNL